MPLELNHDQIATKDGDPVYTSRSRLSRFSWKLRWRSPARDLPSGRCRAFRQEHRREGDHREEELSRPSPCGASAWPRLPERVSVAMAEIAEHMRRGPAGVGRGRRPAGDGGVDGGRRDRAGRPEGPPRPDRTAVRHGREGGSVTLGGRRVPVRRPRVRAADGTAELPVPAYELFSLDRDPGRWRWSGCWPSCRPAATGSGWSRSAQQVAKRSSVDVQVGGVPPVRGDDRNGAGRAAGRGSVRAGSGGVDDRRRALRRVMSASSPWGSASTGPSIRWRWWRARRRTPPWSPTCWSTCGSGAWT